MVIAFIQYPKHTLYKIQCVWMYIIVALQPITSNNNKTLSKPHQIIYVIPTTKLLINAFNSMLYNPRNNFHTME